MGAAKLPGPAAAGPWAAVVLAAGQSRRFRGLKQIAPVAGCPMVIHPVRAALQAGASRVVVVTGWGRSRVETALAPLRQRGLPVETAFNPHFARGMAASLRAGLEALGPRWPVAVVLLADQPRVDASVVGTLIRAARASPGGASAVRYPSGEAGVPAAFTRKLWPRLQGLSGDSGARAVLRTLSGVTVLDVPAAVLEDVDTPEAYRAIGRGVTSRAPDFTAGGPGCGRGTAMAPIVCLVGVSDSGKTTLIVRLVEHLVGRGIRVATVKHASHGFQMDQPGKDSYRHFHAGAEAVLVSSPGAYALVARRPDREEGPLEELLPLLPPVDLVLVEGFKGSAFPTIEVHRQGSGRERIPHLAHRVAVVSDQPVNEDLPWFHLDDTEGIADLVLRVAGLAGAGEPGPGHP